MAAYCASTSLIAVCSAIETLVSAVPKIVRPLSGKPQ
jgi:hypothetical protein